MKLIKNKYIKYILFTSSLVLFFSLICNYKPNNLCEEEALIKEVYKDNDEHPKEISEQYTILLENLFDYRNKAILDKNEEILKGLYDTNIKFGLWAYEHEVKKMQY